MIKDINKLPNDPQTLKAMLLQLQGELDASNEKVEYLLEQFRLAQQKRFGASSEAHLGQGELFNEAEVEDDKTEVVKQEVSYTRRQPKRQNLPKDLPREVIIHDISDDEKTCDCCGEALHQMGESVSEKLEFIPAQIKVIEHVRLKYSCRGCDKHGTKNKVKIAPLPTSTIPKGIATPSLLSQIITSKYQYGLPLYRQESMFKQYGIALGRKTMSEWMIKSSILFKPIVERLQQVQLEQCVIHADETPLKVIKEDKKKCYMWVYCTGTDSPNESDIPNIVIYDYQNSRAGSCPVKYLGDFNGYLQVDGYAGYHQVGATLVGCMAHARRKFKEAEQSQPKGKTGKSNWALNHIQKLYRIETGLKGKSVDEKFAVREECSVPLLNEFKEWLDKSAEQVPPKSAIGKAISYSRNQWHTLSVYVEDGHLAIDNNRAERAVKPFVIGRKNWMFSNTANGADASAVLYSIIETAKANGLIPFDYLLHCFEHLATGSDDIDAIMPWNIGIS